MEHLYFTKVDKPSQNRRKRKGFVPGSAPKNNVQHGGDLLLQVQNHVAENLNDVQRFRFQPHLVMKVELEKDSSFTEENISKLETMGLKVIDTEDKELMVLFADDYELKEFNNAICNYKQGIIARTKIENEALFSAIKCVSRWDEKDRIGQDIDKLSEIDYIDCYLWVFDSIKETQEKAYEFITNAEQNCLKYCDKYVSQAVAVVRLKVQKKQLPYFLKHPLVYKIDRIPNYHIKRAERTFLKDVGLNDIKYSNEKLTEESAAICVIDSGVLSGHPLLKDAIGDAKTFYATDGYTPNENDIDGHGTMVAGICEYGIVNPRQPFFPQIYLYNAKIHDGQYIGDFDLCIKELGDEKIEISFEQEELLYNYFSGGITEEELFNGLDIKTRVLETKAIVKKYTHMHEKLIVNQMREIVEYFNGNYGCRIFNLSQGDMNFPYDDKKPRAWTCVLDELQCEYDILFVVSSGNYDYAWEHDVQGILNEYPRYFFTDSNARIIDPAASCISLTVGGMANSKVPYSLSDERIDYLAISRDNQVSSGTRIGPGIQKSIKPELVAYAGDVVFNTLSAKTSKNVGCGILSFSNKLTDGLFCQDIGTSLAAPYVSHIAALVLSRYPEASNNLVRAILTSASFIPKEIELQIDKIEGNPEFITNIQEIYKQNVKGQITCNKKKMLHYLVGYGYPIKEVAVDSFEQNVMLLADMREENAIEVDKTHIFELPIPKEFEVAKGKKKITVSLAYNPDVRKTRMDYLGKSMSFELIRGKDLDEVYQVCASQAGLDEEDKTERFEKRYVCDMENCGKTLREHGTLQKGTFEFSRSPYGDNYYLVVDCKKNWSTAKQEYALVVTYQVQDESVKLYDLLKNRIRVPRSRERV